MVNVNCNYISTEFVGFKQCMECLIGYGLLITTFICDHHVSIASHMKDVI